MQRAKTVNLDAHAVATLRYIRASMDAAGSVAIPGSAGIYVGIIGTIAAALSLVPSLQSHWFAIWIAAAPVAAAGGAWILTRSGSLASFVASGTPGRKLALGLIPCLFAGAVMTFVLWQAALTSAIAGTWLLLYGCALICASVSTIAMIVWMGVSFVALGIAALAAPAVLHVPLLGIGFGGLHLLFGILISRSAHARET